jgi:hypothetical protein
MLGGGVHEKNKSEETESTEVPRTEMIKESLNWLDRYLGTVK